MTWAGSIAGTFARSLRSAWRIVSSIDRDARNCASVMSSEPEPERGAAGCAAFSASAHTLRTAHAAQIIAIAAHGFIFLDAMQRSLT
jgi:hypothetical protein